jgi:Sulfotransferase family/Sulfotransferase domain
MSTTVLYIAGTGRSGSTLLASILGEVEGVFAAGEVRYLWQRGLAERRLCGCGVPVRDCPVWSRVLAQAGHLDEPTRMEGVVSLLKRTGRIRNLPGILMGSVRPGLDPARSAATADARAALGDIYASLADVTGNRVIVDSSKLPAYANVLAATPGIDLRVVHLIRDPRGAAHSWSSRKALTDGAARSHMEQIGPVKSAFLWDVWNLSGGLLFGGAPDRYLRLRYEDFIADPQGAVRRILSMVGMEDAQLPFVGGNEAITSFNHSVAGNPDRLRSGLVRLRQDDRWRTAMARRDQRLVSALTLPLLLHYGYTLRPKPSSTGSTETIFDRAPQHEGSTGRVARRVRRHLRWIRTEGWARIVEEDELNPVTRVQVASAKWRWRRSHPQLPGSATPVYLVGLQRSGTNMLARGLDTAPEFEVHNENDRAAFNHYLLLPDARIRSIVMASKHQFVLFKPLCDSHRVDGLLDSLDTPSPGRAIWAYRDVDGRVRSAVSKFGRNNLLVLGDIAAGNRPGMWQAERLSEQTLEQIRSFDYTTMTPETAAALFWWVRNGLFFDLGFHRRADVLLTSYQDLLTNPSSAMESICRFLGFQFRNELIEHISPRAPGGARALDIDPQVRLLCTRLQDRLDEALRLQSEGRAA